MKKPLYLILSLLISGSILASENPRKGNVALNIEQLQDSKTNFETTNVLTKLQSTATADIQKVVKNSVILSFNGSEAVKAIDRSFPFIKILLPIDGEEKEILLYESDILPSDFRVVTSKNPDEAFQYNGGRHYRGIVNGDQFSLAAISIFNDEIMGFVSTKEGNYTLGKIKNDPSLNHILYNDKDLLISNNFVCSTADAPLSDADEHDNSFQEKTTKCVRMYWEANYDIFLNKGSVTNAANYLTGLFNQSSTIYSNDGITLALSEVFVWDSPSVYSAFSSSDYLYQFQSYRTTFNGDDAQLLSFDGFFGGIAFIDGLCSGFNYCYSGIYDTYSNVPVYSWSVMVVTHEQGHNFSSPHTHACAWNGNNTAIDNCGPTAGYGYEGSCSGAPTPTNGGTVMSYCHLLGIGINLANGFGSQPAAKIISRIESSSCLSSCASSCSDNYEPNNTSGTSVLINANSTINGLIDVSTDKDWFRFKNTTANRNIKVTLTNMPADFNLRLYKGSALVAQSNNISNIDEVIVYNTNVVGTYKIRVAGSNGFSNNVQCYTLTTQISAGAFSPVIDNNGFLEQESSSLIAFGEESLNAFPNPANNTIQFFIPSNETAITSISIIDKLGRVVGHFQQSPSEIDNKVNFDVSHLSSGLYFIQMRQGDQSVSLKQLIQH
jgi:hypothetical protein